MDTWNPIETAPHGRDVLVAFKNEYGHWRRLRACYYDAGELIAEDSSDDVDDDGYAPEGWYEECYESNYSLPLSCEPIIWHPLPGLPQEV